MKLAHISDTHLGYYAYGKTVQGRLNAREVDVAQAFQRCLDAVAARDPDIVLHSGDFFHHVRPSNFSLIFAYRALTKFQTDRGGRPLVIIGGNHDTPRNADQVNILKLFADIPGVRVETGLAASLEIDDMEVLCVPSSSVLSRENVSQAPALGKKHSLKLLHGLAAETRLDETHFALDEIRPDDWTYVALGDFHVHTVYRRNVCYAGSTEFTSTNPWEEVSQPKGWVWFDTEVGELEFVPVKTRRVIDLPIIDATELSSEQLAGEMLAKAVWDDAEMPIVRQRVFHAMPEIRRGLGVDIVRKIESRCLHYTRDIKSPVAGIQLGDAAVRAETLEASWTTHIDASPLAGGVDRAEVKKIGLELLQEVAEHEADPVEA